MWYRMGKFVDQECYVIMPGNNYKADQQNMLHRLFFKSWLIFFFMMFAEVQVAVAKNTPDLQSVEILFQLINERLHLMKDVAAFKYTQDLPTYVPGREQQLLADIRQTAEGHKLDVHTVQLFLDVQLRMAVELQNQWRKEWTRTQFPKDYPIKDLYNEIRPELSRLTNDIVRQIAKSLPLLQNPEVTADIKRIAQQTLEVDYLTADQKELIVNTLLRIKRV